MEAIWTVVCGKLMLAKHFNTGSVNPTLDTMRLLLQQNGCPKAADVPDFKVELFCSEDSYDFWHGSNTVDLSEVKNYEYYDLAQALIKAAGHGYPVYLCLSRGADPERENLSTFAVFLLAYLPRIQRPLGVTWTRAWEIDSGAMTRITYGEVCRLYKLLQEMKILHL